MDADLTFDAVNSARSRLITDGRVRFYLVGAMRVTGPQGEDLLPAPRKVRAMLAYLCLAGEARTPRRRLISLLWGDSADEQAGKSLRHALWQLSRGLNAHVAGLIQVNRDTISLDKHQCWIDACEEVERGDRLLEGFDGITILFDRWLAAERTRLEDRTRTALEQALQRLIDDSAAPEKRATAARRLTNFEPTHEGGARALMAAFYAMGDSAQAIREFERCRQAMQAADLPLSSQTIALHESIRLVSANRRPRAQTAALYRNGSPAGAAARENARQEDQASIAVLPFRSLTNGGHYDYAAAGIEDNLVEGLSRIPDLFVVSRMSTLAFRGESRPAHELGEMLGVRYVVSGKMGVMGDRIGVSAQLNDTAFEAPLWSCTLDERSFDWAEVNARLTGSVARRVAPWGRGCDTSRTRIGHPEAYDLFLRAQENMHNSSRVVFATCEDLLDAAITLDPENATALAWRARWHLLRVAQGWSPDPKQDAKQADHFARRAVQCDEMEPMALAIYAYIAAYLHKDFDLALRRFETALRVNPNAAPAWFWSATVYAWLGEGPRGVEHINRAMALSPYDPLMHAYNTMAGLAYLVDGQFQRAVEHGLRAIRDNRSYISGYTVLAMALVLAGHGAEARGTARELVKLEPSFTVARFREHSPACAGPNANLFCDALARAGIPVSG